MYSEHFLSLNHTTCTLLDLYFYPRASTSVINVRVRISTPATYSTVLPKQSCQLTTAAGPVPSPSAEFELAVAEAALGGLQLLPGLPLSGQTPPPPLRRAGNPCHRGRDADPPPGPPSHLPVRHSGASFPRQCPHQRLPPRRPPPLVRASTP
jgi:hypothetical protein